MGKPLKNTRASRGGDHKNQLHQSLSLNTIANYNRIMYMNPEQPASAMKGTRHTYSKKHVSLDHFHHHSPMKSSKPVFSQANASWETSAIHEKPHPQVSHPVEEQKRRKRLISEHLNKLELPKNPLLENDAEIQGLLSLLRSNDFAGKIDPQHHSGYFVSPDLPESTKREKRMLSMHCSDGQLLKCKRVVS